MFNKWIIGFLVWLVGVLVAWIQIRYWNRDKKLIFPEDYCRLTLLALLSWAVYPVYLLEEISNGIKK